MLAEEVQRLLADGQDGGLARLHFAPCKLEHIGVVAAGKTAVAGNDDEERLALFFRQVRRDEVHRGVRDVVHRRIKRLKIGAAGNGTILRAAELGRDRKSVV